ncbi:hypothetical protein PAEVO_03920 [Paenibacillus sp. GM2FR]|uniref:hypothetical protein n=1 Tax=Paenibacillus sp. GM2FR TaxID=2059268 RepID=UPI000C280537|nr:hypothetical protein [Paenibacillus sp. GM2FR]PJN53671.1 hypothetical protein PAEVO_03920 [Paenibacillus sp. GM2FR]
MATYDYGIRQGLNSKGVDNGRIGYSNGYVTVDGKNFMQADYNNKGTALTNQQNFKNAWNSFSPAGNMNMQKTTSPFVQAASNVKSNPQPTNTPKPYTSPTESTLNRMNDFINNNSGFQFKAPDPFEYNPQSDPAYLSQLAEAKRNIADQQVDTNAVLRAQGQGKSSYSELVQQQIGDKTLASLADTLVPQLMNQAYQRYNDDANRSLQVQQMNYGTQQDTLANLGNLYGLQHQEYFQNPIEEAQLTGNYLPNEAKQAISNLLDLKRQAETKGISREDRAALSQQADGIRSQLQALGIDPSFYGADVNSKQASQNNPALRTLQGQQMDMQRQSANWDAARGVWDATGRLVSPQSDWSGLIRQAQNGNTPLTMAAQQQAFNNNLTIEEFAYQKARDSISDQQWRAKFDEDVRQFGLNYAMAELQEQNQQAYREAQIGLSQDDSSRAWAQLDYEMSNPSGETASGGLSANQVLQSMKSLYTDPVYTTDEFGNQTKSGSQITKDQTKREQMFLNVVDSGLSDAETNQILNSLGMTKSEIDKFMKKYGASSGN